MPPRLQNLNIFANPICVKCARERLRWKHILSWGTVVLTLTAFICMGTYLTETEREIMTPERAAKSMLIPLIVIQAVLLMFFGTGAVASNLAREREGGLIDYQRMTPMSPAAKIAGYLFGLPAREYFLFALTIPFLLFAVLKGSFPFWPLAQFYIVFFTSVWLYHMTGMVAGMASSRPRFAAVLAQGMVIVLYFVLPRLEIFGFAIFEHLTMLPIMIKTIIGEIAPPTAEFSPDQFYDPARIESVPFFVWEIVPFVFSLLVQGFLLAFLYIIVHRKWKFEHSHPFSKVSATLFFVSSLVLLAGNLWPLVADAERFTEFLRRIGFRPDQVAPAIPLLGIFFAFVIVSGLLALLMVNLITPSRHTAVKGLQLARKLGRERVALNSDAASSLPATIVMVILTLAAFMALIVRAERTGIFFEQLPPAAAWVPPLLVIAALFLFIQGLCERFSKRVTVVVGFLMWMIPFFTAMILFSAFEFWVTGSYIGLPFPPFSEAFALGHFIDEAELVNEARAGDWMGDVQDNLPSLAWGGTVLYTILAAAMQIELWRWKGRVRQREMARMTGLPSEAELARAKVRVPEISHASV